MVGDTGKHDCVEDAKIDAFVEVMNHTILVTPCYWIGIRIVISNTRCCQSRSCCSLRLTTFPVARKLAPSIDPVVKAQHDPHLPCIQIIMHKTKHPNQFF